jgi:hypothetical protein
MEPNQAANAGMNDYLSPAPNAMPYAMPNVQPYVMPNAPLAMTKGFPVAPASMSSDMAAILVLFILLVIISRMGHGFHPKKC